MDASLSSGLSTQITIKVGATTVGAIQSLTVSQNRDVAMHEEIGTDGIVDSHPKNAAKVDLQVERIVFDQMRLTEAFSRGFINLQAQRISFDIQIIDTSEKFLAASAISNKIHDFSASSQRYNKLFDAVGENTASYKSMKNALEQFVLVHILHGCWFTNYTPTFTANNFIISEKASIRAEKITSHRGGVSAVNGGLRGIDFDYDNIERNTDTFGRVGRLDPSTINTNDLFRMLSGT